MAQLGPTVIRGTLNVLNTTTFKDVAVNGNIDASGVGTFDSIVASSATISGSDSSLVIDSSTAQSNISFETSIGQDAIIEHRIIDQSINASDGNGQAFIVTQSGATNATVGLEVEGEVYANVDKRVFHDGYHPNADKLTSERQITITQGGDLTGSASVLFDGSKSVSMTLNASVKDDSHNHIIANVDGLQTILNATASDITAIEGDIDTLQTDVSYLESRIDFVYKNYEYDSISGQSRFDTPTGVVFRDGLVLVYYNGVMQAEDEYTIDPSGSFLTLSTPVANNTDVVTVQIWNKVSEITFNEDLFQDIQFLEENKVDRIPDKSIIVPVVATASRPLGDADALLSFNPDSQAFEGYNPSTGEWGEIGGGGVPAFIRKTDDFIVEPNKAYEVDMSDNLTKNVTINIGDFLDSQWFAIKSFKPTSQVNVKINLVGNVGDWVDFPTADTVFIPANTNSVWYVQKSVDGWSIVNAAGESYDGAYVMQRLDGLEAEVDVLNSKRTGEVEVLTLSQPLQIGDSYTISNWKDKYSALLITAFASDTPGQRYEDTAIVTDDNTVIISHSTSSAGSGNYSFVSATVHPGGFVVSGASTTNLVAGYVTKVEGLLK